APPGLPWRLPQRQQTRRGTNGDPVRGSGDRVREQNEGGSWYLLFELSRGEREHRVQTAIRQLREVARVDGLGCWYFWRRPLGSAFLLRCAVRLCHVATHFYTKLR